MRFRQWMTVLVLATAMAAGAAPAWGKKVPTREFFKHSLVSGMKISPDGEHVALTYEDGSQVKLAIMRLADEKIVSGFEFGENMHVLQFWWGSDERVVMSVGEVTGNLDNLGRPSSLYAADIDGGKRKQIFEVTTASYQVLDPLPDDERNILIARRHWADGGEPRAALLDMHDGDLDFLAGLPVDNHINGIVADNAGEVRAAVAFEPGESLDDGELRLYVRDEGVWESLELDSERRSPSISFLGFSKDNRHLYFASNHDMAVDDRRGVFRYDFDTNEVELLYRHPEVDVRTLLPGPGQEILGAIAAFGPAEYTLFDDQAEKHPEAARILQSLLASFPEENVFPTSVNRDGTLAIIRVTGDRNPGEYYLFDIENMQMRFLSASLPDLPQDVLVRMEPVKIEARDGLVLHAFLTRPAERKKDLPLIVNVHGGPFGPFDSWGYNPEAQFFAHHGYATLQVNFRGSGNRGADFQAAGWREWGGKMQDDVTDATKWAIEQGIADPERICIYGGSYGGYATLMGVVKEPDLYECGVGYVGVYDLPWFRSGDGSDFNQTRGRGREARAAVERFMSTAVGDDMEKLRAHSPVHHVDRIEADLFIVHGASDVRVPVGHAHRLREALDEIGKDYEWMIKEKEGHGFYDVDNRVDLYNAMLDFFDEHIGPEAETGSAASAN
ncbi:MAG: S9 family peptidase [Wenzhouxiangellaceae bacterium]|nr:S9 family peptidase [Wenzhouxiangellaceae bacterium]